MAPPAIVSLHQVSKVYTNGTVALQGLNLTIGQGEFVSLVGPSGCGKSTVLRILAGLSSLSRGQMIWRDGPTAQKLAYVFQEAALMPWATVFDNVRLPLKLAGVPRQQSLEAVSTAIARVGLQRFERAYPRELSGGMRMRVSIARALVTQPQVLLMDEPFGALDEMTRSRLNSELLALSHQMGWTVVFVTHNIYEAVYLSNRVMVMSSQPGQIVAEVALNAPDTRDETYRTSPLFNQYYREISHHLAGGMLEGQGTWPSLPSRSTPVEPPPYFPGK